MQRSHFAFCRIAGLAVALGGFLASNAPAQAGYVYTLNITGGFGCASPASAGICPADHSAPATVPSDFILTTDYDAGPPNQILNDQSGTVISPKGVSLLTFPDIDVGSGLFTANNGTLDANLTIAGEEQGYLPLQIGGNLASGIYESDPFSAIPPCATSSSGTPYYQCTFNGDITSRYIDTPEPASAALLPIALLGLIAARRRQR